MREELIGYPKLQQDRLIAIVEKINAAAKIDNWEEAIYLSIKANYIIPNVWRVLHNLLVFTIYQVGNIDKGKCNYDKSLEGFIREHLLDQAEQLGQLALQNRPGFPYGTLYNLARIQCKNASWGAAAQSFSIILEMKDEWPTDQTEDIAKGQEDFDHDEIRKLPVFKKLVIACRTKHPGIKPVLYEDIKS